MERNWLSLFRVFNRVGNFRIWIFVVFNRMPIISCVKCNRKYVEASDRLCDSCRADELENEFHNKDIVIDEQHEIDLKEVQQSEDGFEDMENEEAEHFSERAERDAHQVWEDGRF